MSTPRDPREWTDAEQVQAERLSEALDAFESGDPTRIGALSDPEIAALVDTASQLRTEWESATETTSYRSYRARSRAYILHTLEQQHAPVSISAARTPRSVAAEERRGVVPFLRRHSWVAGAPLAAAAAALSLVFFAPSAGAPGDEPAEGAAASNQTAASTDVQLLAIQQALDLVAERTAQGKPVDAPLLRAITEGAAAVANRIETSPQSVTKDHVSTYQKALAVGNAVLTTVQPAVGSENALAAAQRAAADGVVTAARFFGDVGATASTATPEATAIATATPARTATPVATPSATVAPPSPTASATPEATATSTPAPTASATATPTATPRTSN